MKPTLALLALLALAVVCRAQDPAPPPAPSGKEAPAPGSAPKPTVLPRIILGGDPAKSKAAPVSQAPAPTGKATPARGSVAPKSAKKVEPPAKIEGMEIARGEKGFLGLQVVEGTFQMAFYDAKKKPAAPDVVRAVLRWTPNYKPGTEVYVLGPSSDGKKLTVAKNVRPPYSFKLFISLFSAGSEDPTESFVVDFRQ